MTPSPGHCARLPKRDQHDVLCITCHERAAYAQRLPTTLPMGTAVATKLPVADADLHQLMCSTCGLDATQFHVGP